MCHQKLHNIERNAALAVLNMNSQRSCRGAQKPCYECMTLMTLCALMSLCVVEVHASPTQQSSLTWYFWNTYSQCHQYSNGQFLPHTYLWCCRNYKAMLTTLRCTHAPNGVSHAGPLHAFSRLVHRNMHLCAP